MKKYMDVVTVCYGERERMIDRTYERILDMGLIRELDAEEYYDVYTGAVAGRIATIAGFRPVCWLMHTLMEPKQPNAVRDTVKWDAEGKIIG